MELVLLLLVWSRFNGWEIFIYRHDVVKDRMLVWTTSP